MTTASDYNHTFFEKNNDNYSSNLGKIIPFFLLITVKTRYVYYNGKKLPTKSSVKI